MSEFLRSGFVAFGAASGACFLRFGLRDSNETLAIVGAALFALGVLAIRDALRPAARRAQARAASGVAKARETYEMLRRVPEVLRNQEAILRAAHRLDFIESQVRLLAANQLEAEFGGRPISARPGAALPRQDVGKIRFAGYPEGSVDDLQTYLAVRSALAEDESPSLLVSDLGDPGELSETALQQAAEGQVDLAFWIGKRAAGQRDLLIVPRAWIDGDPGRFFAVLSRLEPRYRTIVVGLNKTTEDALRAARAPAAGATIDAEAHLVTATTRLL